MGYDNAVRHAVRTVKNPTNIPVYIEQQPDGDILLHVDHDSARALPKAQRANFLAYIRDVINIIEVHGGVNASVDMRGAYGE